MKRTICLDFDGCLHSYTSRWKGPDVIPDPPVDGAAAACRDLRDRGFHVVVFSTRCATNEGIMAVRGWLNRHGIEVDDVVNHKPPALVYVDDRAVRFEGDWTRAVAEIVRAVSEGTWQGKARE